MWLELKNDARRNDDPMKILIKNGAYNLKCGNNLFCFGFRLYLKILVSTDLLSNIIDVFDYQRE